VCRISGDGQGAVKSFNPAYSNVLGMVAEEDEMRKRGQASRHHAPVHSNSRPHHHQHQQQQQHGAGHLQGDEMAGTSDF